jgi:hypothetical protein
MEFESKLADYLRQGADALVNFPTEAQRFLTNPQAFTELVTGKNPLPKETGFVAGASGLPPKNPAQGGVLNPASAPYQEGYEQGEPVAIASMALPAYASALRAAAPKAYNALENYMVKSGGMIPLEAYHGTPHKIQGAFDISKVGTGEGAQAYGHGMYFAENPAVATEYRKSLSGRTDNNLQPSDPAFIHAVESFRDYGIPLEQIPAEMKKAYKTATNKDIQLAIQATEKGNLYKVDIPDEHIPNMLDWDKPLREQANIVEMLKSSKNKDIQKMIANLDSFANSNNAPTGQNILKTLGYAPDNPKKASKLLDSLGIKGVRYLDEGSRASKITKTPIAQLDAKIDILKKDLDSGLGNKEVMERQLKVLQDERARTTNQTSNFVVFDPSTVKILEENGKPLNRKELIQQQIDKIE